jgi:hypothetical protein
MAIKYSSIGGGTGTGFNVQIGSQYSYATFTQAQPAGAYTIKSSNNYTNWDVYLLDASNNLVAYTGSASVAPTTAFSAIVVVNGTLNDILQFSFQSTVFSTATTSQTKAGPFITSFGSSVIPSVNSAVTITGGNFAVGITATFTGTDSVVRTCKSVVYTSLSSISVVRPDVLPIAYAPYTLTLTNPGVNNPATSGKNTLTGLTVGNVPVWSTATSLPAASGGAYSTTLLATDVEGAVTYSYVSGTLPAGLSFNAATGVISGTYSGLTDGTASYTVRATDNGGNFIDRTFTIGFTGISGGTLASDVTYYYRVFPSNGTLVLPSTLTADVLVIAGGAAGGGWGGGGGSGGAIYFAGQTLTANSYTCTVGAGGTNTTGSSYSVGGSGINSTFGSLTAAVGGGGGGGHSTLTANSGGSGGGSQSTTPGNTASGAGSTQTGAGATAYYGGTGGNALNAGGNYPGAGGGGGTGGNGGNSNSSGPNGYTNAYGGAGGAGTTAFSSWLTAITPAMTSISGWSTATSGGAIAAGGGGHSPAGWNSSLSSPNTVSAYNAPGGAGGGGRGGNYPATNNNNGTSGITNTGSGGGGAYGASNGNGINSDIGSGGSGLIVVRYTRAQVGG